MIVRLASRLEHAAEGRLIDLTVLDPRRAPLLAHQVLLEGHLLTDREPSRRVDFEVDTYRRAFDFRPTFEIATRGWQDGIRARLERLR